jgi:STE24 endopeptidase
MPFFLLLLLLIVCLPGSWPQPLIPAEPSLVVASLLTVLCVAISVFWAARIAQRTQVDAATSASDRSTCARQYSRMRARHGLAMIGLYGLALFVFGWGWVIQTLLKPAASPAEVIGQAVNAGPSGFMYPGSELLILLPYIGMVLLSWAFFYDADRAIQAAVVADRTCSRWAYVAFRARQSLAFVAAPLLLMMSMRALQFAYPDDEWDWFVQAIGLAMLPVMVIAFPFILRAVWGLRPLPDGALRRRLVAAAERLKFRCSNILVWNTHNTVANAMVAGIVARPRYVLLSDRLINELTPDEIEAVFGHEVGHVRHHHMLCYLGFLLLSVPVVASLCQLLSCWLPGLRSLLNSDEYWANIPFVGVVATYIFVVFGFLSRRCERQADVFGCRAVSCSRADCMAHEGDLALASGGTALCPTGIRTFIGALEKVAEINGISRSRPGWLQSWLHSTFARRIDFLERILADPATEVRFQRGVRRVKWTLGLGLAVALGILYLLIRYVGSQGPGSKFIA